MQSRLFVNKHRAPKNDPVPVKNTRLGIADVDYDGRGDLILYSEKNTGTPTSRRPR